MGSGFGPSGKGPDLRFRRSQSEELHAKMRLKIRRAEDGIVQWETQLSINSLKFCCVYISLC